MTSQVSAPSFETHPLPHVDNYLDIGQKAGASDVHLGVAAPPIWRVHGTLQPIWPDAPALTSKQTAALAETAVAANNPTASATPTSSRRALRVLLFTTLAVDPDMVSPSGWFAVTGEDTGGPRLFPRECAVRNGVIEGVRAFGAIPFRAADQ